MTTSEIKKALPIPLHELLDRFEIWSPDRYEEIRGEDQVMAGTAFSLME